MEAWQAATDRNELKKLFLQPDRILSIPLEPSGPAAAWISRPLRDLTLPPDCLVAVVHRGGESIVPSGQTELESGDRLTILGSPEALRDLYERYVTG